jgi:hypothetical protein
LRKSPSRSTVGDDRLEARGLGAQRQHPRVELAADLQLGAARAQRPLGGQLGQRPVGDRARPPQRLHLVVVLDGAQRLDRPPDADQLHRRGALTGHPLQRAQPVDGDHVGLVAQPGGTGRHGSAGQRQLGAPVDQQLHVGHLHAGLGGVPAVGAEEVAAVGAQQQRSVGAGEPGQVADVEQGGHQDGVQPPLGRRRAQPVAPLRRPHATPVAARYRRASS